MRKKTLLLSLLFAFVGIFSTNAQVVTKWTSTLTPVSLADLTTSAGTGARYAFRMPSWSRPGWCDFVNVPAYYNESEPYNTLTPDFLFTISEGSEAGKYWLTRASDGKSLSGNSSFADTGMDLTLTDRAPENVIDYADGLSETSPYVSFDNASGQHYNCGNGSGGLQFRGGTGGWSVYAAYGPFYVITVVAKDESDNELGAAQKLIAYNGTVIDAPSHMGYRVKSGGETFTVNGTDSTWNLVYEPSSINYTVSVTSENGDDVPATISIKGTDVTTSLAYTSDAAISESDVTVQITDDSYSYYTPQVTLDGTTVKVFFSDTRWPINFPKDQVYTHPSRHLNGIGLKTTSGSNDKAISGLYNGTSTTCFLNLTTGSEKFSFKVSEEVIPYFQWSGNAMRGFVYIDINNNGSFADEGELVSYELTNLNGDSEKPAFVLPATPGTFRMRYKVDWNSLDPGGEDNSGSNYIIQNGGSITDVLIELTEMTDEEKLNNAYARLERAINDAAAFELYLGPNYGDYTAPDGFTDLLDAARNMWEDQSAADYNVVNTMTDSLDKQTALIGINLPAAGSYLRIVSTKHAGQYLSGSNNGSGRIAFTNDGSDSGTIYYFDGNALINYATGDVVADNGLFTQLGGASATPSIIKFEGSTVKGNYNVIYQDNTRALFCMKSGDNYYTDGAGNTNKGDGYDFTLEKVTELPLTMTTVAEANYSTLYLPVNVKVSGAEVFGAKLSGSKLEAVAATNGEVPANTGVILKSNTTTATATIVETAAAVESELAGVVRTTATPANSFVFSIVGGELGFYRFGGDEIKANKAYYTSTLPVQGFGLSFDVINAIKQADTTKSGQAIYDLSGRRVQKAAKGVYIVGGKKVIK